MAADAGGKPTAGRRPSPWLRTAATGLVARVENRGMTLAVETAETIVAERVTAIAAILHISERTARSYTDEDGLDGLATGLMASFAAEEPGADLLTLPRDGALRMCGGGRLVAALAQSTHVFLSHAETDEALSRSRAVEIIHLISTLGLIQADHETGDVVFAPRALFTRISRILDGAARLTTDVSLRDALRRDAFLAEAGSKTHVLR